MYYQNSLNVTKKSNVLKQILREDLNQQLMLNVSGGLADIYLRTQQSDTRGLLRELSESHTFQKAALWINCKGISNLSGKSSPRLTLISVNADN